MFTINYKTIISIHFHHIYICLNGQKLEDPILGIMTSWNSPVVYFSLLGGLPAWVFEDCHGKCHGKWHIYR